MRIGAAIRWRYQIAAKAVFADLGRYSEHDKTKNFDSDLTATESIDKSGGEDWGESLNTSKKRRGRDQWWPGQWCMALDAIGWPLRPPQR